jgi:hypothetical protein
MARRRLKKALGRSIKVDLEPSKISHRNEALFAVDISFDSGFDGGGFDSCDFSGFEGLCGGDGGRG